MQSYHLVSGAEEICLAAGLKLPLVLKYTPRDSGAHYGEIMVYVNDHPASVVPIEA